MTKEQFIEYADNYDNSIAFIGIFDGGIELFNSLSDIAAMYTETPHLLFREYNDDILIFNEHGNLAFHAFKVHKALLLETAVSR